LAACAKCAEEEVTKKWRYLRSQLTDEVRKEKRVRSGMSTDDAYVSKWRWRQLLAFLEDVICVRPAATLSNLNFGVGLLVVYDFLLYCYVMFFFISIESLHNYNKQIQRYI